MSILSKAVAVYCDGGLLSRNPSEIGGTWAFCAVDDDGRKVGFKSGVVYAEDLARNVRNNNDIPLAREIVSNNHTEHIAIVRAIEALPFGWSGTILSDSNVALTRVQSDYELVTLGKRRFPAAENNLWPSISRRSKEAVARLGVVSFVLLQGHPTKADLERGIGAKRNLPVSIYQVWCDKRCEQEKRKYVASQIAAIDETRRQEEGVQHEHSNTNGNGTLGAVPPQTKTGQGRADRKPARKPKRTKAVA